MNMEFSQYFDSNISCCVDTCTNVMTINSSTRFYKYVPNLFIYELLLKLRSVCVENETVCVYTCIKKHKYAMYLIYTFICLIFMIINLSKMNLYFIIYSILSVIIMHVCLFNIHILF